MPLVPYSLRMVKRLLDRIKKDPKRLGRVLCLSHPDVVAHPDMVSSIFGLKAPLVLREDSEAILGWHKASALKCRIPSTPDLFKDLGFTMDSIDVTSGRGTEEIYDLSEPLPEEYHNNYDLVYDCISNQCFNVAQCMANAARVVRVGGFILHTIPVVAVNQGFWSVGPTAYHDFYDANGFDIEHRSTVEGIYHDKSQVDVHDHNRTRGVPEDAINMVVARKLEDRQTIVWPIMKKFRDNPKCLRTPDA